MVILLRRYLLINQIVQPWPLRKIWLNPMEKSFIKLTLDWNNILNLAYVREEWFKLGLTVINKLFGLKTFSFLFLT